MASTQLLSPRTFDVTPAASVDVSALDSLCSASLDMLLASASISDNPRCGAPHALLHSREHSSRAAACRGRAGRPGGGGSSRRACLARSHYQTLPMLLTLPNPTNFTHSLTHTHSLRGARACRPGTRSPAPHATGDDPSVVTKPSGADISPERAAKVAAARERVANTWQYKVWRRRRRRLRSGGGCMRTRPGVGCGRAAAWRHTTMHGRLPAASRTPLLPSFRPQYSGSVGAASVLASLGAKQLTHGGPRGMAEVAEQMIKQHDLDDTFSVYDLGNPVGGGGLCVPFF